MEKNIVVIDLEKYENLIKKVENQKNKISELENEIVIQVNERETVNSSIYSMIYKDMGWHLQQIVKDKEDDYGYHHNNLKEEFKEYGYNDENYINECIENMINDKKIELEKESE